jgi:hypothetical protein
MQLALNHVNWDMKCILRCGVAEVSMGRLVEDFSLDLVLPHDHHGNFAPIA